MAQVISSPVLVGRAAELARLGSALERAATGEPVAVVVAGEAGMGKTRLVTEFAGQAGRAGAVVLAGGCLNVGDGILPYAPVMEALRSLAATLGADELDAVLGGARPELARLVPELGTPAPVPVTTAPGRLFELLLGVVNRLAERGPVLVVVEDLHWADRSTLDLLEFLLRNLRAGVVTVLTYRTDELHPRHPLRPFLAEMERRRRAERLELHPLTRPELAGLMARILGHPPAPRLVADVVARAQGNPFFAEELLAADPRGAQLPSALRDLLLARVEALSEEAQQVLRVAAAAGSRVDHQLLATVAAMPEQRLLGLLREAVTRHLLVADEQRHAYRFRHALVQEALHDDLLPGERSALHAAYARALAGRRAEGRAGPADLGQLAFHWYAAHDTGAALLASVEAGQAAEAAYALAEAELHYERALELFEVAPTSAAASPLDRTALLQRAANAAMLTGRADRAVALERQALASVDRAAEPLRAGALLERLGRYQWMNGDSEGARASLEQALAAVPAELASRERARALAADGQLLMLGSRNQEAVARCQEAVARQVGARAEEGHALNSLGVALEGLGRFDEGMARLREARRIVEELGDPEELCRVDYNLTDALIGQGRAEAALAQALLAREVADQVGTALSYGIGAVIHAAEALVLLGRWEEAERLLTEEVDLDLPSQQPVNPTFSQRLTVRGRLRLWQGDLRAARADLDVLRERGRKGFDPQVAAPLFSLLTRVATWEGELAEARAAAAQGLDLLAGCDYARFVNQLCLAGVEAEAATAEAARARRSAGQVELDRSRRVGEALLGRMRAVSAGRPGGPAAAELLTAEAEWSRVEGPGDPARWAAAVAAWDALGSPFPAAYARFRRAEALLGEGTSRAEAAPVLRRARLAAAELGAGWLEREATALARRSRVDLDPDVRPDPPPAAPSPAQQLGLTPREQEVLALVADGRTNRQIAQTLFISDKTASVHVSRILAKLGVSNRAEAGAVAHRLHLTG